MQILINSKNEITDYVIVGNIRKDGHDTVSIENSQIPDLFIDLYKPRLFLYKDEKIIVNKNYDEQSIISEFDNNSKTILEIQNEINYLYEHLNLERPSF